MNILLCSVGRRVKLVEYFKAACNERNGKIIAIDCDSTAAALYFADEYEIVPRIDHPEYISIVKHLCRQYEISAILSLIDPELSLLATHKEEFELEGVTVVVSNPDVIETSFDKYLTYEFLKANNLPFVPTYTDYNQVINEVQNNNLEFPLIAKPRHGSASIGITKVHNMKELEVLKEESQKIVIQPFLKGEEYGVDCYVDIISKETISIFLKKKLRMRGGETDKSVSIVDPALRTLIEQLLKALGPIGPVDVDCFMTNNGYVISEINPRFGGGYLHAYEAGQNFVKYIIKNICGNKNIPNENVYKEGTILVKYDSFIIM
ncbi:ATP-grasp domain-containing protein [Robertmurraya korlensis]|uniref:ATP-grasp domain-containing protein n=1 Tax=Robertmurraya korlensis TaxID=519977 RepID=UPI0020408990|nr:ATP-grasp domain-containing protein [Robertmurraya korlensis]MCM3600535.1 ATP-grasp domain-containing protein [Robertmurraya korlensis]